MRLIGSFILMLMVFAADPATGRSKVVFSEKNKYFISETGDNFVTFLDDNEHFVIMSERSGWMHFYLYDMEGNLMNPVTRGNWDVDRLYPGEFLICNRPG